MLQTHTQQFNSVIGSLPNLTPDQIQNIKNYICDDSDLSEEILESFYNNSVALSQPMPVNWEDIVVHIFLETEGFKEEPALT